MQKHRFLTISETHCKNLLLLEKETKKDQEFFCALQFSGLYSWNFSFRFLSSLKAIKRTMSKVETIVCCSKYCQNDFRYLVEVPRREALASHNLAFPLVFFNLLRWNLSKFSQICENRPADHLNAEKIGLVSSLFAILCFLPLFQIRSYEFFSTGTMKGKKLFNSQANLRKLIPK